MEKQPQGMLPNLYAQQINLGMLDDGEKERSYHSQDKRRSVSREEARRFKLEKVKMRFKNIASRIKEIKNENSSDLSQLTTLIRNSDQLEQMASQSLEKATLFLSESKLHRKRVASPNFHEAKLAHLHVQEFNPHPIEDQEPLPSTRTEPQKKKPKNGKGSVAPSYIKTDQTSESQVQREFPIERISEIEIHQQYSGIKEEVPQDSQLPTEPQQQQIQQPMQKILNEAPENPPSTFIEESKVAIQIEESKMMRQSTSNRSLLKSGSRVASTQGGSLRASLRRTINPPPHNRRSESIYPYIAIILFSIIFLLLLR